MEYPGYSVYYHEKSSTTIEQDSVTLFDYFVNKIGINPKDIILCGRSIGSGPACYLAANRNPGAVILIAPFTSIKNMVRSLLGFLNVLVADR
jgi:acetyl esterase/lipase